ncbi:Anhydrotetracycline monooxygenase [Streptomyces sp. RB5]|uniref:Anhydrotetracycline monooxygenase n=1 Tax=Streptomyces smaragdinus TaxID=2585196 RepID=A0A7K0CQC6_9ACTN|nr:FAD-dependent monooxygenase [Streptomyces smaragdinus]MQY15690.1 Anhydrotetracycline monooxygenase [Streptomyces smaragdinus]
MNAQPRTTRSNALVVGSGPTGLLLAGDLAAAGIEVTVLERRAHKISNLSRAFGVHARTLEQLDARGLADALTATGGTITGLQLFGRLSLDLATIPSRYNYLLITPQYEVEKVLEARARELGVEFVYEAEVTGLTQDADGVDVEINGDETRRAAYVVGTDGHHSAVRAALGLPFPGVSVIKSLFLADVRLDEKPEDVLTVNGADDAFAMIASFGDGWYRVMGWNRRHEVPDDAPIDLDEIKEVTRRALGTDYGMRDARWISRFHSDERQAPAYRDGRVFLAGDAAHIHSPAGGQGMNTGLQDAANLGWKLAGVLNGWAPESLLDTYQAERHPVGKAVLRSSGAIVRMARAQSRMLRTVRTVAATVVSHSRPAQHRALGQITGLGYHYPAPHGAHKLAGHRAPDLVLADGRRLYEALREGKFVLVSADGAGAAEGREDRVVRIGRRDENPQALLVRPDGYIAWASDAPATADLERAVMEWAGERRR